MGGSRKALANAFDISTFTIDSFTKLFCEGFTPLANKTIFPSSTDYEMNRSIMVVGAHADDNEIHVGGTLLKYHALGYDIVYVMSTNNMSGGAAELQPDGTVKNLPPDGPIKMSARRKSECDAAAAVLGTTPIHLDHPQRHYQLATGEKFDLCYGGAALPDGVSPGVPSILTACEHRPSIEKLADLIVEHDPECVLTHGLNQVNIEHFATGLLTTNAYWRAVDKGYKGALLQWVEAHTRHGEAQMRWDTYVDYSPLLDEKMKLVGLHACQKPLAHLPNFGQRLQAKWWGSACGCIAAEVFQWVGRPLHRDDQGPILGDLMLELINHTR